MGFEMEESGNKKWFEEQVICYDPATGLYGAYFPSDYET